MGKQSAPPRIIPPTSVRTHTGRIIAGPLQDRRTDDAAGGGKAARPPLHPDHPRQGMTAQPGRENRGNQRSRRPTKKPGREALQGRGRTPCRGAARIPSAGLFVLLAVRLRRSGLGHDLLAEGEGGLMVLRTPAAHPGSALDGHVAAQEHQPGGQDGQGDL